MKNLRHTPYILCLALVILAGCSDPKIDGKPKPDPTHHADYTANQWIYNVMRSAYLWNADIANIKAPNYEQEYTSFFNSLLKVPAQTFADGAAHDGKRSGTSYDPYSYIERDATSKGMSRSVSGSNSFGIEFILQGYSNVNDVYAMITYVVPGSPADGKLKRNDWIGKIDRVKMTRSNYTTLYPLLLPSKTSKTIVLTTYSPDAAGKLIEAEVTLSSNAVDDNPVLKQDVIQLNGGAIRVGYLAYNGFDDGIEGSNSDAYIVSLKNAFTYFKDQNITHFVLDLRYNPGGYVHICTILCSMIASEQMTGSMFAQCEPNPNRAKWQYNFMSKAELSKYKGGEGAYLDLNELYVLTSDRTASASEMVINGLRGAGITVHQIGSTTEGKNVGSELYDKQYGGSLAGGTYGGFQYSIRPITFQIYNAKHQSNYANGFTPNYEIYDDYILTIRKELGDPEESFLKVALTHISTGNYPAPVPASASAVKAAATKSTDRDINISSTDFKRTRGLIDVADKRQE